MLSRTASDMSTAPGKCPCRYRGPLPPPRIHFFLGGSPRGASMSGFVTHLESALDGTRFPAGQVHTVHQGRPLWVRYDLAAVRAAVTPDDIARRGPSLWRYRELLPLPFDEEPVTLGEGMTPLLPCPR